MCIRDRSLSNSWASCLCCRTWCSSWMVINQRLGELSMKVMSWPRCLSMHKQQLVHISWNPSTAPSLTWQRSIFVDIFKDAIVLSHLPLTFHPSFIIIIGRISHFFLMSTQDLYFRNCFYLILLMSYCDTQSVSYTHWRCRRIERCRSRWSPYH